MVLSCHYSKINLLLMSACCAVFMVITDITVFWHRWKCLLLLFLNIQWKGLSFLEKKLSCTEGHISYKRKKKNKKHSKWCKESTCTFLLSCLLVIFGPEPLWWWLYWPPSASKKTRSIKQKSAFSLRQFRTTVPDNYPPTRSSSESTADNSIVLRCQNKVEKGH